MKTEEYTGNLDRIGPKPGNTDLFWIIGSISVIAVAAFVRFWQLALRPLHHDEGVNGYFLKRLFKEGVYQYDPANYHGPDLYYLTLVFAKIFGLNTLSVRGSVALFGVLTVVLVLYLHRYIGRTGALAAALLTALSPGMVFISRYFIHEILFVFFGLAIVVSILFFIEKRRVGIVATGTMTLLLLVCFLPTVLNLAEFAGDERVALKWALRISLFLVEAILVFMIMRMLFSWDNGRPIYLLLASASAVMLFATKETAFITIGTMMIGVFCVWLWRKFYRAFFGKLDENDLEPVELTWAAFSERAGNAGVADFVFVQSIIISASIFLFWGLVRVLIPRLTAAGGENAGGAAVRIVAPWVDLDYFVLGAGIVFLIVSAAAWFLLKTSKISFDFVVLSLAVGFVFVYLGILFFSSFFTYPEGVVGAFEAYAIWTKTGSADHTQNGWLGYLKWGYQLELAIFVLSFIGTMLAFLKARHRFAMFAGLWAFGLFAAYTIIPYKTPWLALSFLLPMCIVGGYGINELAVSRQVIKKIAAAVIAVAAFGVLAFQTYDLNFVRYDDENMAYVYAHTRREFLGLVDKIDYYAEKSKTGKKATIEVITPEYWPMPWYTNDYDNAAYGGQVKDINAAEMIIASQKQKDELKRYQAHYKFAGEFPLRPGVDLYLLVRRNLADADAQEIYQIVE